MKVCPHCLMRGWKSLLQPLNPVRAVIQTLWCPYCGWVKREH